MKKFILVVKIVIPIAFFAIANISSVIIANSIAGVMVIAVTAMYLFEHTIKDEK